MAIKTSKSAEGYFAKYKQTNKEASNRKAKLERQLKLQPNNTAQIDLAIKNIHHRRKTPVAPYWSASMIRLARVFKKFQSTPFNKDVFSTDPVAAHAAARSTVLVPHTKTNKQSMFSIGERAHNGAGLKVW